MSDALTFDEPTHTYRVGDVVLPSVTQVLDPLQQLDGIPPDVLARAAKFGTHVHKACHLANQGRLLWDRLDPHLKPYVDGWQKFQAESCAVVVASEVRCWHRAMHYAGTCDAIVRFRKRGKTGAAFALDIKTAIAVPRTVGPQTAAYADALRYDLEYPIARTRYCVQLRGDGTYRLVPLTQAGDLHVFRSALNLHRWRTQG
jgi:hypothetical protein